MSLGIIIINFIIMQRQYTVCSSAKRNVFPVYKVSIILASPKDYLTIRQINLSRV